MRKCARKSLLCAAVLTVAGAGLWMSSRVQAKDAPPADPALERSREMVRMLDDVYKTTIVLITDKYVHDKDDFPAGSAAVALFKAIGKKGWHEVRLLDATGDPIEQNNAPRDEFEKAAIEKLKKGESYVEEIVKADGKRTLRAATPVPVVSKKCILCHAHYADVKEGAPIGALSYTLPIK